MPKLEYANSFRDLIVYRKSRELSLEIFKLTKRFPKEETYSLTDQVRRSSRSIGAQIAEAWAKRQYPKHFLSKLTDSDGDQQETQHWIETVRTFLKERRMPFLRNVLKLAACSVV